MISNNFWTPEKVERLTQRWKDRQTAAVIAEEFGTTRNAILGKINRLGLSCSKPQVAQLSDAEREERRKVYLARQVQLQNIRRKKQRDIQMPKIEASIPDSRALLIPLMQLRDYRGSEPNQCRYIADEPPGPDYIACGLETAAGASYCPSCLRVVKRHSIELSDIDRAKRRAHFLKISPSNAFKSYAVGDAA